MREKREARIAYYRSLKETLTEHMVITEKGLRALSGISEKKVDKIVASVRKRHEKLLRRIDRASENEIELA